MSSSQPKAKSYIDEIKPYKQGKSKVAYDGEIIKLSSNENALGASPNARKAFETHSENISRYSDGSCLELRKAIAQSHNIKSDRIVCGAGSDEIIALLIQAFAGVGDEIIYSQHGFLMYPISAQKFGAKAVAAKETNLTTNIDNILALINDKTKMIFIANPNNPTGSYLNKEEIQRLIDNTPKHIVIVLDLAYAEFSNLKSDTDYPKVVDLVENNKNVVMTRTFSKIYGLASIRLGWSYSSEYIAEVLNKNRGPFNVGGQAIEAGVAAVRDEEFLSKSIKHNNKWLETFKVELDKLNIKYYPSVGNFILIDFLSEEKCQQVNNHLLSKGIIVREMQEYQLPTCLRVTIGTDQENTKIINEFKNY